VSTTKRLNREEKKAQTHEALLDAAARLFAERGFGATAIEQIAEEAGFSRGAFYSNFATKEELFAALLQERVYERYREMTRERMNSEVLNIWQRTGITVVFVTHSIPEAVFLSTRVVVISARPGRVTRLVEVDLPQPRGLATRESSRYFSLITEVREALRAGEGPVTEGGLSSAERTAAEGGIG